MTAYKRQNDRGIALIAVLCILLLITMLTMTIISVSKICAIRTAGGNINTRSMLVAEGTANRIFWLLQNDRKLFKSRQLGNVDYSETQETERLMADGVTHTFDYYGGKVEFKINDLSSGMPLSGSYPVAGINKLISQPYIDESRKNNLEIFRNRLLDYVDKDSLTRLNSLEENDYSELGLSPLPRNDAMQFREEILYIPGNREFSPSMKSDG